MVKNSWRQLMVSCVLAGVALMPWSSRVSFGAEQVFTDNVRIETALDPKLFLDEIGQGSFSLQGNGQGFSINDELNFTSPFFIQAGAPDDTLHLSAAGSVGIGTFTPQSILSNIQLGRLLNVRSSTSFAQLTAQGSLGGILNLVHEGGSLDQKHLRLQVRNGSARFEVLKDDFSGLAVANILNMNLTNGSIGLGVIADVSKPLRLKSGAFVSAGGVFTNASSRTLKQDIEPLTSEQARDTVQALRPVGYRYKNELDETYVGFIAEDVPALVATNGREGLGAMDIVAVLTKVVQDQNSQIEKQHSQIEKQQRLLEEQHGMLSTISKRLDMVEGDRGLVVTP